MSRIHSRRLIEQSASTWKYVLLLACNALMGPLAVAASDAEPMRFTVFAPCDPAVVNVMCSPLGILAEGVVTESSAGDLERALADARIDAPGAQPDVFFNSPGGSLAGALKLGETIRRLDLGTRLYSSYDQALKDPDGVTSTPVEYRSDVVCASACVFAFAGGSVRMVGPRARMGVHQFFANDGSIGDSNTQVTMVLLAAYLEQMGVDRQLLDVAALVPPAAIRFLTAAETSALRLDNTKPVVSEWKLKAGPQGELRAELTRILEMQAQVIGMERSMQTFAFLKKNGVLQLELTTTLAGDMDHLSEGIEWLTQCADRSMTVGVDGSLLFKLPAMAVVSVGHPVVAAAPVQLSDSQLRQLLFARKIAFEQLWVGACSRSELDFTGEFDAKGLASALSAIIRN